MAHGISTPFLSLWHIRHFAVCHMNGAPQAKGYHMNKYSIGNRKSPSKSWNKVALTKHANKWRKWTIKDRSWRVLSRTVENMERMAKWIGGQAKKNPRTYTLSKRGAMTSAKRKEFWDSRKRVEHFPYVILSMATRISAMYHMANVKDFILSNADNMPPQGYTVMAKFTSNPFESGVLIGVIPTHEYVERKGEIVLRRGVTKHTDFIKVTAVLAKELAKRNVKTALLMSTTTTKSRKISNAIRSIA